MGASSFSLGRRFAFHFSVGFLHFAISRQNVWNLFTEDPAVFLVHLQCFPHGDSSGAYQPAELLPSAFRKSVVWPPFVRMSWQMDHSIAPSAEDSEFVGTAERDELSVFRNDVGTLRSGGG